ncbi:glycoside hydrolase family 13 protein [Actinocorallia longicatena]|uniref:Glycoside hydrolase family 13 protein n=1 Tax=Actinocorallia longicatena TaxID=111803 RepID=A0ABP6QFU2_9ACTN
MTDAWWRDAVIYQVYLRSFLDSDGDGVGDLEGLRGRLDHLQDLGVDGLWLNPCYPSPGADHGYDVADYTGIDAAYGGLPAFDRLLADVEGRGMKLLMDLVPNHCSAEHPWFQAALRGEHRERFIFRDGRIAPDGTEGPPNNWLSAFGGPAWTRVPDGQWYLHSFDPAQPDFDWRNEEVAAFFDDVLRFWFDRGVHGMRIDVAHMLFKNADLPDWDHYPDYNPHGQNQPEVHDVLRRWRSLADSYDRDLTLVGEIWVPTVGDLALYLREDELPQAFYFDLLLTPWDPDRFRTSIERGLEQIAATGATITWTLANHDVHRTVSRYGLLRRDGGPDSRPRGPVDLALGTRRARAAMMLLLALPGSVYLYQGEELGLPEVIELPDEVRQDPTFRRSGPADYGRDGCRVPLPWTPDPATAFGFSPTGRSWLPQPAGFASYTGDNPTLELHRKALALRRSIDGPLTWLSAGRDDVLVFSRGDLVNVTVFGDAPCPVPWTDVLLTSADPLPGAVAGGSTTWFRTGA